MVVLSMLCVGGPNVRSGSKVWECLGLLTGLCFCFGGERITTLYICQHWHIMDHKNELWEERMFSDRFKPKDMTM